MHGIPAFAGIRLFKESVQLTFFIQRIEIIAAADVLAVDKDLWNRFAPTGFFYQCHACRIVAGHVDFLKRRAFALQQLFGFYAIRAVGGGVELDHEL